MSTRWNWNHKEQLFRPWNAKKSPKTFHDDVPFNSAKSPKKLFMTMCPLNSAFVSEQGRWVSPGWTPIPNAGGGRLRPAHIIKDGVGTFTGPALQSGAPWVVCWLSICHIIWLMVAGVYLGHQPPRSLRIYKGSFFPYTYRIEGAFFL